MIINGGNGVQTPVYLIISVKCSTRSTYTLYIKVPLSPRGLFEKMVLWDRNLFGGVFLKDNI